jgi:hypothetical protein
MYAFFLMSQKVVLFWCTNRSTSTSFLPFFFLNFIQLSGAGACDMANDYPNELRCIVAQALQVKSAALDPYSEYDNVPEENTMGCDIITGMTVEGCDARRRQRSRARALSTNVVTITFKFSASPSENNYMSAQGIYEEATTGLKAATGSLQAAMEATCGCELTVEAIRVTLTKRWEPDDTLPVIEAAPTPLPFYSGGDCPNGCSGHGACSTNGCVCYRNWGNGDDEGGACDTRMCPEEIAWVDTPIRENQGHRLAECAGRGICDRATGDCLCFPGFEGKGCRRTSCPNDCSGHGTCEFMAEMRNDVGDSFKWTGSKSTRDQYDFEAPLLWDAYKTRGCVCDPKWTGLDCGERMCPRADFSHFHHLDKLPETQAVILTNIFTPGTDEARNDFYDNMPGTIDYKTSDMTNGTDANGEFALTFRSTLNEEFTTRTLNAYNLTEEEVEGALGALPNKVIEDAHVLIYRNLSQHNLTTYYKDRKWNGLNRGFSNGAYPFDHQSNVSYYVLGENTKKILSATKNYTAVLISFLCILHL